MAGIDPALSVLYARTNTGFDDVLRNIHTPIHHLSEAFAPPPTFTPHIQAHHDDNNDKRNNSPDNSPDEASPGGLARPLESIGRGSSKERLIIVVHPL